MGRGGEKTVCCGWKMGRRRVCTTCLAIRTGCCVCVFFPLILSLNILSLKSILIGRSLLISNLEFCFNWISYNVFHGLGGRSFSLSWKAGGGFLPSTTHCTSGDMSWVDGKLGGDTGFPLDLRLRGVIVVSRYVKVYDEQKMAVRWSQLHHQYSHCSLTEPSS